MKRHFFKSLKIRILVITIVSIIPFIAFSVYDAALNREQDIVELKNEALQLVNFTLIEESQTIDGTRQLLISLANLPNEYLIDSVRCNQYFKGLLAKYRRYINLGIVDDKGILFASAQPGGKRIDYSNNNFFIEAMRQKGFSVGEYLVDPISRKRMINLGYPIHDKKQNVKAVVFASLDISYLEEYEKKNFERISMKERIFIKIDNEGDVLISNIKSDDLAKSLVAPSFINRILEQETGILETSNSNNQKYLFVFASTRSNLFQKTIRLIVGVNKEKFFSELNKRLYRNLFMIAFFFTLILVGVLILSDKYILKIVEKLITATKEMADGNLRVRSNVDYDSGELGQLAMTFDRMAESLEEQNKAREKSEESLRESEERYRLLFENSLDAILLTEPGGIIYSANPAACRMFQKTEEEICRQGRDGLVNSDDARLHLFLEERRKSGHAFGELTLFRKEGTIFPAEVSSSIFYDSQGEPRTAMIIRDITGRKQAEEQLIRHEKELKLLSSELVNAHENEKKTLALELHDEIGQALTAMKINLSSVIKNIPDVTGTPNGERLMETDNLLDTILSRVHEISLDLRPVMLDVLGFVSTIKSYGQQFSKRTGIQVHIENKNKAKPDTVQEIHLFRIVQESLTNTAKHAEAQNINIQMESKNKWFCLIIEDDGKGFDRIESVKSSGRSPGIGLIGINERVISMQGELNITSGLQKGTKIEIKVPLNGQKK